MKHHLVVIYDGIENSVFAGQVLAPLVQRLQQHPQDRGLIISFEQNAPSPTATASLAHHPMIDYRILRKIPFLGSLSLYYAVYQLRHLITSFTFSTITIRGPLAAWIVAHTQALRHLPCIVQARGLAAQEYAYAHQNTRNWFKKQLYAVRTRQYEAIERYVYGIYAQQPSVTIRAVSDSLRTYLIITFGTPPHKITVEAADIPPTIDPERLKTWRCSSRTKLNIKDHAYVYVYNGSAKAWQCPQETVAYFAEQYQHNTNLFLLILTQDQQSFIELCIQYALPQTAYHITQVRHSDIYHYLAAADAGIIFREQHIINWVSRPTKILEYQAVGLKIIHNNTVALLAKNTL